MTGGDEARAMRRALVLAASGNASHGPNPRVGCVLLAADGGVIAEGFHRGVGTAHAEVDALQRAGDRARGATAVVTLEPCNHTGRTGPCSRALIAAGVRRVVFAQLDPNPLAAGGNITLRAAGIEVESGLLAESAMQLNEFWTFAVTYGRPFVTWKSASTLDGRVAAADGTSRWISSPEARADVHAFRATVDAILVGTGTALVDDPHLAVRDAEGNVSTAHQPLRVVMGERHIPLSARIHDDAASTVQLHTRDPKAALVALADLEIRHLLLEGGPTLAAAFVRAGLIDAIRWYVAPALLGAGPTALGPSGLDTISQALRLRVTAVAQVGVDVRIEARVASEQVTQNQKET
jgi:diaminohydroxyphosphoribosylaminopyrimidine deaminase/5-amino-6-(5-phosphoribosylamino)uracil reductase